METLRQIGLLMANQLIDTKFLLVDTTGIKLVSFDELNRQYHIKLEINPIEFKGHRLRSITEYASYLKELYAVLRSDCRVLNLRVTDDINKAKLYWKYTDKKYLNQEQIDSITTGLDNDLAISYDNDNKVVSTIDELNFPL